MLALAFRKRYDRAEREFIESKIDLHKKAESKDLLTEHLYTVIHQNEMRKAKKLAELMRKLELESGDDTEESVEYAAAVDAVLPSPVALCITVPPGRSSGIQHIPSPPADITNITITNAPVTNSCQPTVENNVATADHVETSSADQVANTAATDPVDTGTVETATTQTLKVADSESGEQRPNGN